VGANNRENISVHFLHDCRCDGSADYRSTGFLAGRGGADGQVQNKRSRGDAHVFGARALLRYLRPELEREHARILKQDPAILFDEEAILRKARPGDLYFGNTDPVLLAIASSGPPAKGGSLVGGPHHQCARI
jgi:hypothetical protein